jgi:4-amino-4-deoxy-L-arabinose transferase-like glycosyltransferase
VARLVFSFGPGAVLLLLLAFAGVWLALLNSVALVPPADNIEQLTWMHSLQWGYYKHPPLPTWLMLAFAQLAGWSAWASELLGALCTLTALALYWAVLRDIEGRRVALLGLLAALCITFYNGRINYYNHNIVLMVWVAASAWLWWRILTRAQLRWWLLLGLVAGLGMLSKYQYAVTATGGAWLFVQQGLWRSPVHRRGALAALAVAGAVVLPHALWLLGQDQGPIAYAMRSSLGAGLGLTARLAWTTQWLADWLLNRCLPAFVLLAVAWGLCRRTPRAVSPAPGGAALPAAMQVAGRSLLQVWGVLPPAFMVAMGVFKGVDLQLQWGTAFALWGVPVLMAVLGLREAALRGPRTMAGVAVVFVVLQAGLLWQAFDTSSFGHHAPRPAHWRQFPAQSLAAAIAGPAERALGGPIRILSGPGVVCGAVALWLPSRPRVLIDGDLTISPWISGAELQREGVLELWPPGQGPADVQRVVGGWGWRVIRPGAWFGVP